MERWLEIDEFPGYSISDQGRVRNDRTERLMVLVKNRAGVLMVGLVKDGIQYKRSIAKLVAERFLPHNTLETFDTPMHLDGDRTNCAVRNLVWRPKWYVFKYLQQFETYRQPYVDEKVMDEVTGYIYADSWEAAISNGLREYEVAKSIYEDTTAWPTYQKFRLVD
jgi:NUMOD4 motif-containing protein